MSNENTDNKTLLILELTECAPTVKTDVCSAPNTVDRVKKKLNLPDGGAEKIIEAAKKKLDCTTESCVLVKTGIGIDFERFRPHGPFQSVKWLSNDNIDNVLAQYAKAFPRFKHVKFQMRDFEEKGGELARIKWEKIKDDYDSLGCVLNTDVSSGSGEHWTPIYIDFKNATVEYFDSAGQRPHAEFITFVAKTANALSTAEKPFEDKFLTDVKHQRGNTECGVYSLYYILSRLHDVSYKAFEFDPIPDAMMVEFRKTLFVNDG